MSSRALAVRMAAVAMTALLGSTATAAPSAPAARFSGTVPNQSIATLTLTAPWDLTRADNFDLPTPGRGAWSGVTVTGVLPPGQTFAQPAPTLMALSPDLTCPLTGCPGGHYVERSELKTLRPGRYVVVVYGPDGGRSGLTMRGITGRLGSFRPLPVGSKVSTTRGTGPAGHHTVLDRPYPIRPTRSHTLSGFMYRAAVQQPGQETLVSCAGQPSAVSALTRATACRGISFVFGPSRPSAVDGVAVTGWYSLGNISPASEATGDGQFLAQASGPQTDLLLMDWELVLPF